MKDCRYIVNGDILNEEEFLNYLETQKDILDFFDKNVLLHEVIHPFIDTLQFKYPTEITSIYNSFISTKEGQKLLENVKKTYGYLSPKELEKEVLTRAVQNNIEEKPKSWSKKLIDLIKKLLGINKEISFNTSVKDLADLISEDYVIENGPISSIKQRDIKPLDPLDDSIRKIEAHIKKYEEWKAEGDFYTNRRGGKAIRATRFVQDVLMKSTPYSYNEDQIIKSNAFNDLKKLMKTLSPSIADNPTWTIIKTHILQGYISPEQLKSVIAQDPSLQEFIKKSYNRQRNRLLTEELSKIPGFSDVEKYKKAIDYLYGNKNHGLTDEEIELLYPIRVQFDNTKDPEEYYSNLIKSNNGVWLASSIWMAYEQKHTEELAWKSKVSLFGNLIHKIMENIAQQYKGKIVKEKARLDQVSDEGIKDIIGHLYEKEIEEYKRLKSEILDIFNQEIFPLIEGKMVYSEIKLAQEVELDGNKTLVMGTSDLFVINPDGTHFIIDYKSSLKPAELWNKGKIQAVNYQMMLYSKMAEKTGIAPQSGKLGYSINIPLNVSEKNFEEGERKIKTLSGATLKRKFLNEPLIKPERRDLAKEVKLNQQFGLADKINVYTKQNILPVKEFLKTYFNWEFEESVTVSKEDIDKKVKHYKSPKVRFYVNRFTGKKVYNPYYQPKNEEDKIFRTEEARLKALETYEKDLREYIEQYLPIERNQPLNLSGFINEMQEYEFNKRFSKEKMTKPPKLADLEGWNNKQLNSLTPVLKKYWSQFVNIGTKIEAVWENISTPESLALGIIMMRNRVSGMVEIVNLSQNDLDEQLELNNTRHKKFIKSWVASDSIGGNFLDGEQDANAMLMKANWGNVESIKAFLYLANNPQIGKIGSIVTISPSKDSPPVLKKLTELDREVKKLLKVTPQVNVNMRKTIESYNAYAHKSNAEAEFFELISFYQNHINESFGETGYKQTAIEQIKKYKPQGEEFTFFDENRVSLKEALYNIYQRQNQLRSKSSLSESEQEELAIISKIILAAENIEVYADEADVEQLSVQIDQPDEQRSPLFKKIRDLVIKARTAIKREYNKTFDNVRDVFKKYYEEVGRLKSIVNPEEVYRNLFEYDVDEQGNVFNTLRLRDPDSNTYDYTRFNQSSLTSAEKEFLRGVIKELKRLKQSHIQSNAHKQRAEDIEKFYRELPVIAKGQMSKFAELLGHGDAKEALLAMKKGMEKAFGTPQKNKNSANENSGFKTKFYTFLNAQTSIDSRNQQIQEIGEDIETNVETLLFLTSYNINRENEFNKVLPQIAAIRNLINLSSFSWFKNYPELLNLVDTYVNNNVFGRAGVKEEQEEYAKLVSQVKNMITLSQLGFNVKTASIQLVTSLMSTISTFAGQGSHLLSKKGFIEGLKYAISPMNKHQEFIRQLNLHYDIVNINPETLMYDRRINKSVGNYVSGTMMWMNSIADTTFRKAMWISQAVKDGVIKFENGDISPESAIRLENGKLIYDPTKDERYKDYFKKGPKYEEHKALFEAKVLRARREGTLDPETGMPLYAYDSRELEAKQKLISDTYADMTSENRTWFERTIVGMLWVQFKRFMFSKKNQYITKWDDPIKETRTGEYKILMVDGKPVLDENGNPIEYWEGHLHEGILNTLVKIAVKIANEPFKVFSQGLNLTDFQKRNLKHFASDMGMLLASFLTMYALAYDDEEKEDRDFLDSIATFIFHANRDSTIFAILNEISVNSPFVAFNIIKRFAGGVIGGIIDGNPQDSLESVLRGLGVTRSGLNAYEFVSGDKVFE